MKVKNISKGVISIGIKNLIPGSKEVELTATEAKTPAIVRAIKKGKLVVVTEKATKNAKTTEAK